jgi:hypothetical protein
MKLNLFFKLLLCCAPLFLTGCAAGLLLTEAEVAFLGSSGVRVVATSVARSAATRVAISAAARSSLIVADEGLLAARASRLVVNRQGTKVFLRAAANGSKKNVAEILSKRSFKTIQSQQVVDLPGDIYFVTTGELNVRSGPGRNYPSVATIKEGRPIAVESEEKGWYKVWVNDAIQGWVRNTLVKALELPSDSDKDHSIGMQSEPEKEVIYAPVKVEAPYNPYGIGNGQILFYCSSTFSEASKDWSIYVDDAYVGNLNGISRNDNLDCQNEGLGVVKYVLKTGNHAIQLKDAIGNYRKGTITVEASVCKPFDCLQLNTEIRTIHHSVNWTNPTNEGNASDPLRTKRAEEEQLYRSNTEPNPETPVNQVRYEYDNSVYDNRNSGLRIVKRRPVIRYQSAPILYGTPNYGIYRREVILQTRRRVYSRYR